jgi:hypothetical protein
MRWHSALVPAVAIASATAGCRDARRPGAPSPPPVSQPVLIGQRGVGPG